MLLNLIIIFPNVYNFRKIIMLIASLYLAQLNIAIGFTIVYYITLHINFYMHGCGLRNIQPLYLNNTSKTSTFRATPLLWKVATNFPTRGLRSKRWSRWRFVGIFHIIESLAILWFLVLLSLPFEFIYITNLYSLAFMHKFVRNRFINCLRKETAK